MQWDPYYYFVEGSICNNQLITLENRRQTISFACAGILVKVGENRSAAMV